MGEIVDNGIEHLRKANFSQYLWSSVSFVIISPLAVYSLVDHATEITFTSHKLAQQDVLSEGVLMVLLLIWLITIAFARLEIKTYLVLSIGFALMAAASTTDLLDEFVMPETTLGTLIENTAYPLGMGITSIGLWMWEEGIVSLSIS